MLSQAAAVLGLMEDCSQSRLHCSWQGALVEAVSYQSQNRVNRTWRSRLETDVLRLQKRLEQERDLHDALESAIGHVAGDFPQFPQHLPVHAQELLADIAMLENAVSKLEEQMVALNLQLGFEQRERVAMENSLNESSRELERLQLEMPSNSSPSAFDPCSRCSPFSAFPSQHPSLVPRLVSSNTPHLSPSHLQPYPSHSYHSPHQPSSVTDMDFKEVVGPHHLRNGPAASDSIVHDIPHHDLCATSKPSSSQSFSSEDCSMPINSPTQVSMHEQEKQWPQPNPTPPDKPALPKFTGTHGPATNRTYSADTRNLWRHPNKLSQEMVSCMIDIYCHLADPAVTHSNPLSHGNIPSPTSPFGQTTSSSLSSVSESSLLSFARSPPLDLRNREEVGNESTFDPYRTREKLPWADIGRYGAAVEVSWMSVGKEQLEYAADALRTFRFLVEQLSKVDPSSMKHEEKLAFWINIYNTLMMHAYLAYGVPRSDLKFFSLMQKAAYTVGGHSFNAVSIEHVLLRGKAPAYRPQIALLLALHKLKLPEELNKFAIDRVESLVTFSLTCGAFSSPAVRIYTAENIESELQSALVDYVRASVGISCKGKLLVPKLLHMFGRDLVEESALVDWICQFLPWPQSTIIQDCMHQRRHTFLTSRSFAITPFDFRFRYLFLLDNRHHLPPKEEVSNGPELSRISPSQRPQCYLDPKPETRNRSTA